MSFSAVFELEGAPVENIEVLTCDYSLRKEIDDKGMPSSSTRGGTVILLLRGSNQAVVEWMLSDTMRKNGCVRFLRKDQETTFNELVFENAYCVDLKKNFSSSHGAKLFIRISAEKLTTYGVTHNKRWA